MKSTLKRAVEQVLYDCCVDSAPPACLKTRSEDFLAQALTLNPDVRHAIWKTLRAYEIEFQTNRAELRNIRLTNEGPPAKEVVPSA